MRRLFPEKRLGCMSLSRHSSVCIGSSVRRLGGRACWSRAPSLPRFGTAINRPHEYGPHREGFGKRYGARLLQVSADHVMAASMGSFWGEDPHYYRTLHQPFKKRVANILDLTVRAYRSDGERHIAYARLTADVGSNFLANTWLPPSTSERQSATWRALTGLGSRAAGNAAREFLPDVMNWLRRKHSSR